MRGVHQVHAFDGAPGEGVRFGVRAAVEAQERVDELIAGDAARERIELRAVAELAEQLLGIVGRDAEHADAAARGAQQAGHQVHQRGFAGAVRTDQAGDAGRNRQRHAVHAEHVAVELRDVVEDDLLVGPASSHHLKRAHLAAEQEDAERAHRQQREHRAAGGNVHVGMDIEEVGVERGDQRGGIEIEARLSFARSRSWRRRSPMRSPSPPSSSPPATTRQRTQADSASASRARNDDPHAASRPGCRRHSASAARPSPRRTASIRCRTAPARAPT